MIWIFTNSEVLWVSPNDLREMTSPSRFGFNAEGVLFNFIVPSVYRIFSVHFMVWIGAGRIVIEYKLLIEQATLN